MTKDGLWAVCRKSKEDTRGEDNMVEWGWLVLQDIVKSYGKVMTGQDDSLVSAAGQVRMPLVILVVQVLLFTKLLY